MSSKVSRLSKSAFFTAVAVSVFIFVIIGFNVNAYKYPVVGAIFELLWLPVMLLTVALPFVALILWALERFKLDSFNIYTLLIIAVTIGFFFLQWSKVGC